MAFLILGLFLFLGAHSTRIFAEGWRGTTHQAHTRAQMPRWKGMYSVVSIVGFIVARSGASGWRAPKRWCCGHRRCGRAMCQPC